MIVDSDPSTRRVTKGWIEAAGFPVIALARGGEALQGQAQSWAAVCLDLRLEDMDGLEVLRQLRTRDELLPVLVVTSDREVDSVVRAMRLGAYDYVSKPVMGDRLLGVLAQAMEHRRRSVRLRHQPGQAEDQGDFIGSIVGQSAPISALTRQLRRVLHSNVPVSVFGETGTGKELVARAIHEEGARARGPFVAINCGAFSESLLESELFGHERGAFTGATAIHRGCFEQAQGGTLFLDEVGEMSPAMQVRLLRTLQERTVRRVGGTTEIRVDVRIVTATHRDLLAEVKAGRFREDLYYRLAVYPVHVPPLRARASDIPLLVEHFLAKTGVDEKGRPDRISQEALQALITYPWPGNVRELENVVQRAVLSCDGPQIELAHLPLELGALPLPPSSPNAQAAASAVPQPGPVEEGVVPLRELERREILKALAVTKGSVTKAAQMLGLGRATLYRRLGELRVHLEPEPFAAMMRQSSRSPS
ncbi:MAG TPA: sigma-54 dependent transcriptional regulator [Longimicrobium sp.]|nr:sigma-54 dependent transcriptional regulator [Longimicrobium sp.]